MQPALLTTGMHDQQIAVPKRKVEAFVAFEPVFQLKVACRPERKRRDRAGLIDLRLIIRMPSHSVIPIAVKVQKASIETATAGLVDLLQQRRKP